MPVDVHDDQSIQLDVIAELKWDPRISPQEIGVSVHDGVVVLSGSVDSYMSRIAAQEAAHRVRGVRALVNDLEVRLSEPHMRTDEEIAHAVATSLKWNAHIPDEVIDATIDDGWVTLKGQVANQYQRDEAEHAIRHLIGVKGVSNLIRTRTKVKARDIRKQIEEALVRSAQTDARRIHVEVDGSKVTLKGSVRSLPEREDAKRIAWSAPGVQEVDNLLELMS
jgi:osmotically-inducible protein OsmY